MVTRDDLKLIFHSKTQSNEKYQVRGDPKTAQRDSTRSHPDGVIVGMAKECETEGKQAS
jgi:hypothetical protein